MNIDIRTPYEDVYMGMYFSRCMEGRTGRDHRKDEEMDERETTSICI